MTTVVMRSMACLSGHLDGDVSRVRESVEHSGALLGLGHQRLDLLPRRICVDGERHPDVIEAVADVAVGAEDPADVVRTLNRRLNRAQLDAAVLRDGRHTRRQAARQADEEVLDRRDAIVLRREYLGVVGFERPPCLMALLLPETEEALDLDRAVNAALPLGGRPPGELSGLRRVLQHIPRLQQRLHVDSVGNRSHVAILLRAFSSFSMKIVDNTWDSGSAVRRPATASPIVTIVPASAARIVGDLTDPSSPKASSRSMCARTAAAQSSSAIRTD